MSIRMVSSRVLKVIELFGIKDVQKEFIETLFLNNILAFLWRQCLLWCSGEANQKTYGPRPGALASIYS